ncbi:MAG: DUF983 domain-containing protein [Hyphomicrobiales bacterium]
MTEPAAVSPWIAGLTGSCPRCGKGRLFDGFMHSRKACGSCGLDFGFADTGDGPAVFIILFAGFIVTTCALVVEVIWQPPYWVHAALWLPLVLILCIGMLRPFKGVLFALQYHHRAREGQLADDSR